MRVVAQRVSEARVLVDGEPVGAIGLGLAVLVGAGIGDTDQDAVKLAEKLARLRIFADDEGRMNLAVTEVGGSALVVSQFTLYADTKKGNRPSFVGAAPPDEAEALIRIFAGRLEELGIGVATGRFGAHMEVSLVNDGPVTIILDTRGDRGE